MGRFLTYEARLIAPLGRFDDFVGKKVPNLDATVTKIIGVVWIEEAIAYDAKAKKHTVTIEIHNFTTAGKKFNLHALFPRGAKLGALDPKPKEVRDDGKVTWELIN